MANKVLVQALDGTPKQICFANHAGDFSPTSTNDLRVTTDGSMETDCELAVASVANAGYRQSTKVDLGENRADEYLVRAALEFAATPVAGEYVALYWAPSQSATAGTANPANVTGADGAYTGYSSNAAASAKQLTFIGNFICTAQATGTVQVAVVGVFRPNSRYGSLVFDNESDAAMHTDDVECHIVFDPIVPEIQ